MAFGDVIRTFATTDKFNWSVACDQGVLYMQSASVLEQRTRDFVLVHSIGNLANTTALGDTRQGRFISTVNSSISEYTLCNTVWFNTIVGTPTLTDPFGSCYVGNDEVAVVDRPSGGHSVLLRYQRGGDGRLYNCGSFTLIQSAKCNGLAWTGASYITMARSSVQLGSGTWLLECPPIPNGLPIRSRQLFTAETDVFRIAVDGPTLWGTSPTTDLLYRWSLY